MSPLDERVTLIDTLLASIQALPSALLAARAIFEPPASTTGQMVHMRIQVARPVWIIPDLPRSPWPYPAAGEVE